MPGNTLIQWTGKAAIAWICLTMIGCGHVQRRREARRERREIRAAGDGRKLAADQKAEIQVALGRSFESNRDYDKAMAAYREAAQTAPKRPEPRIRMAVLLDRMGRFTEAAPHYEAALKASPGDASIYCDRGYSLCLQGRDAEGEAALRQAIAIKPDLARAHNNLAAVLGRAGRAEEALAEFRKGGCSAPDAHLNLAFALGQARKFGEARAQVELARGLAPDAPGVVEEVARFEKLIARAEMAKPADRPPTADASVMTAGRVVIPRPQPPKTSQE